MIMFENLYSYMHIKIIIKLCKHYKIKSKKVRIFLSVHHDDNKQSKNHGDQQLLQQQTVFRHDLS